MPEGTAPGGGGGGKALTAGPLKKYFFCGSLTIYIRRIRITAEIERKIEKNPGKMAILAAAGQIYVFSPGSSHGTED